MTKFHREFLECNFCLNEEETVVWDVIDAETDPDLVEKILYKDLQIFYCQNCQRSYVLPKPFLLIDRPHKLLIYFQADPAAAAKELPRQADGSLLPELEEKLPHDFGFATKDFSLRLVSDYNDLIEKIHIAREGLSDRLLEIVKLAMRPPLAEDDRREWLKAKEAAEQNPEAAAENGTVWDDSPYDPEAEAKGSALLFLGKEGKSLLFQRFTPRTGWRQLELDESVYDQAQLMLAAALPEEGRWDRVDSSWAAMFTQKASEALEG